jgi:serine/threonine protein kinase
MAEHQFEPGQAGTRRFGDYIIHGLLGEGGMARVYAAEELLSHRPVALKLLRAEFGASEHGRQQFLTEMGILANLDDPRIVRCLTCTQIDEQLVMVLEKLDGRTLRETLKARGSLPWPEVADIVYQIARALVTAHSHRPPIVHRDLKPENVMCLVDGRIKVMDFGIAKMLETISGTTTHSGTPDYMSPEQIDALPIDGRSDLFALGVMAWEMLAGRHPFVADSPRSQLEQVCMAPTPALPEHVRAGLPPMLEQLIGSLLAKQPVDRPRDPAEVVSLLEPLVRTSPVTPSTWTPPLPITPPFEPSAPALEPSLNTIAIVEAARPRRAKSYGRSASPRVIVLGSVVVAVVIGLAIGARWAIGTSDDVAEPKHESEPSDAPDPSLAIAAAEAAYRAAIDAYNAGNGDAYREAFSDPLRCFYGNVDHPRDQLWQGRGVAFDPGASARLFIADLTPLRQTEGEIVFLDRGAWWLMRPEGAPAKAKQRAYMAASSDPITQGVHAKVVVMRKLEGSWRIAAETGIKTLDCIGGVELPELPAAHETCAKQNEACLKECDGTCERCGACNGCNMCPGSCLADLASCVGAPDDWGLGI